MIKIDIETVVAIEAKAKVDFNSQYTDKSNWWPFLSGTLRSCYRLLCVDVERKHNSQLEEAKQGEDAIQLLKEIAENAVHCCGTDYRIDEKWIFKIEELLKSE